MQLGVCNYGKLHAGVRMAKEGKCFYRGVKGRLCKQKRHGFSLDESLLGKKRSLSSSYWALLSSQDVRVPTSGHLTLSEISVYCFILHFPNWLHWISYMKSISTANQNLHSQNLHKLHSIWDSSLFLIHAFLVHTAWISHRKSSKPCTHYWVQH